MSLRAGLLAVAATVLLMLAFGNTAVIEWTAERSDGPAVATSQAVPQALSWQVWDDRVTIGDNTLAAVVRVVAVLLVVFLLAGFVGADSRSVAAVVGGWGAFAGALMLGHGIAVSIVAQDVYGRSGRQGGDGPSVVDSISAGAAIGAPAAAWLGWIVGLAVLAGSGSTMATTPALRASGPVFGSAIPPAPGTEPGGPTAPAPRPPGFGRPPAAG